MKRWRKKTEPIFDTFDIIELYKAEIISLKEARYMLSRLTRIFYFSEKPND